MRRKNDVSTLRYARSFERLQLRTSGFNAAKFEFYTIYLEKCYNRGVRHFVSKRFDVIVTCALSDEIT